MPFLHTHFMPITLCFVKACVDMIIFAYLYQSVSNDLSTFLLIADNVDHKAEYKCGCAQRPTECGSGLAGKD